MCGIAGIVDFSGSSSKDTLDGMLGEIVHRGPDSGGSYISPGGSALLGVRRLSIIDLKTGDQPIKNEDGSVVVTYNGEIYNYLPLKKRLLKKGHIFRTKTDTEVLAHLYEVYGHNLSKYLNRKFAFAIWDEKKQKLILSRDRAGIKPLYYYQKGNLIIYGSELKTILNHPLYKKSIDEEALFLYGYYGFLPGEYSAFRGIKKLLPGHSATFSKQGLSITRYFALEELKEGEEKSLDGLLKSAVTRQLQADVPVGVFLSGGLDSSLIAYYISKTRKLKSFSIGFKEPGFDESGFAHRVAKTIGTEHYSDEFTPSDVTDIFETVSNKL